jgi:large subunit ribosomal protein L20
MPRAKKGYKARRRRNRLLKWSKGYRGKRGNCYKPARESVQHAWRFMTQHRRARKGEFRKLWIVRINAAARTIGLSYSRLIGALAKADIGLDRKTLAALAISDPNAFKVIAQKANLAVA